LNTKLTPGQQHLSDKTLLFTVPALSFYWRVHSWSVLNSRSKALLIVVSRVQAIANSLREPMHDRELASEVRHNLKPDLKLGLLHVVTPSLETFREACHRHEEFYRSTRSKPVQRPNPSKRFVNKILHEFDSE